MFPWNYGFEWTAAGAIFFGAFYIVIAIVAATVVRAFNRARRMMADGEAERVRWYATFHDLPLETRLCRGALTGELPGRVCPNGFDCGRCEKHGEFVAAHPPAAPQNFEEEIFGMAFPLDRLYHRGHTWVRPELDGSVTVGLDELGRRLVGTPDRVELPRPGTLLRTNGIGWQIQKRGAVVRVLAPVDGEVVDANGAERGGILLVKPVAGTFDFRHLLTAAELRPWMLREMERLQLALAGARAPALADGGVPVEDISASCPQTEWDAVCGEMFLQG